MHKILMIAILALCVVISSSCGISTQDEAGIKNTGLSETNKSTSIEIIPDDETNQPSVGGYDNLLRKYIDYVYNLYYGTLVIGKEKTDEWVDNVFLKQTPEEQEAIPPLYQMIQYFDIKKDDLVRINNEFDEPDSQMRIPDYVIDALYADNMSTMKQSLVSPTALYYDGKIYIWYDLTTAILSTSKADVPQNDVYNLPKDVLEKYMSNMQNYFEENGLSQYMQENIDAINNYINN